MSETSDKGDKVLIKRFSVQQVMYYDNVSGNPQIGHFVTNEENEADQEFFANEDTPDMLDMADEPDLVLTFGGFAEYMGKIPHILAN